MKITGISSLKELDKLEIKTRSEAIRAKCFECCGFDLNEARKCEIYSCPLWCFGPAKKLSGSLKGKSRVEVVAEMKAQKAEKKDQTL